MEQLVREGITLCFEDVGRGAPPIVLVHGLACDHTSLLPLQEHFRLRHRVVALDLRGHGESDKPMGDYAIGVFAEDLAWLCYELGVYRPVIVGHGMGAMVALECASRYRDLPCAVVAMDSATVPLAGVDAFAQLLTEDLLAPEEREALRKLALRLFLSADELREKNQSQSSTSSVPREAAIRALEQALAWDCSSAAAGCAAPVLYVDAGMPNARLACFRERCRDLAIGKIGGAGRFRQSKMAEQVNALIERFMARALQEAGSAC